MHWIDPDCLPETAGVVRPRGVAMIAAVSVAAGKGAFIADEGPPEDNEGRRAARKQTRGARRTVEASGVLRQVLHGPRGEVRGLLLEAGRAGRFPPYVAEEMASILKPGTPLLLRGEGFVPEHGTIIAIGAIGTSADNMRPIDAKPPKDKHGKEHPPRKHDPKSGKPKKPHHA